MTDVLVSVPAIGRIVGLDLGQRRVGVAVSDSRQRLATAVTTIHRSNDREREHREIGQLVAEYEAAGVVVGLPLSLTGEVGPAARAALDEAAQLAAVVRVSVVTHDERFTTVSAASALRAGGRTTKQQRGVVDRVAAAVMLQSWIERRMGGDDERPA